MSNAAESTTE
jgi:cytochrome P450